MMKLVTGLILSLASLTGLLLVLIATGNSRRYLELDERNAIVRKRFLTGFHFFLVPLAALFLLFTGVVNGVEALLATAGLLACLEATVIYINPSKGSLVKWKVHHILMFFLDVLVIVGIWLVVKHFNNQESLSFVLGWILMLGGAAGTLFLIRHTVNSKARQ